MQCDIKETRADSGEVCSALQAERRESLIFEYLIGLSALSQHSSVLGGDSTRGGGVRSSDVILIFVSCWIFYEPLLNPKGLFLC